MRNEKKLAAQGAAAYLSFLISHFSFLLSLPLYRRFFRR